MQSRHHPLQSALRLGALILAAALVLAGASIPLRAASGAWRGTIDAIWNQDANWDTATYPNGAGETATLDDAGSAVSNIVLTGDVTLGALVANSAANYTLSSAGSGLTLSGASITTSGTGALTISVPVTLAANLNVTQNGTGVLTLGGNVTRSGANRTLNKYGTGTLLLQGDNSFNGKTTVYGGTLAVSGNTALGSGDLELRMDTGLAATSDVVLPNTLLARRATFGGPGRIAFTSASNRITGNARFYVNTDLALAKLTDPAGSWSFDKYGPGTLDLGLTPAGNNIGAYLRHQEGTGQLNLYGSGTVGRLIYAQGTGGGRIGVGDTLDVAAGTVARGTGILTVRGELSLRSAPTGTVTLAFDLAGDEPGSGYDQIQIVPGNDGTAIISRAALTGTVLDLAVGYAPPVGTTFTLITRSGGASPENDVIAGTFAGLPHGSVFQADGHPFLIHYTPDAVTLYALEVQASRPGALTITPSGGTPQTVRPGDDMEPLTVTVTSDGIPMPGVLIVFTGPASGAGVIFAGSNTVLTDENGQASVQVRANDLGGRYTVTANVQSGIAVPATFELSHMVSLYLPLITRGP